MGCKPHDHGRAAMGQARRRRTVSPHKQPQAQCWGQAGCVPRPVPLQHGGLCRRGTHLTAHGEDGLREGSFPSNSPTPGLIRGAAVARPALGSNLVPGVTRCPPPWSSEGSVAMQHHDSSLGQCSLRLPATVAMVQLDQHNFLAGVCNSHSSQALPEQLNPNRGTAPSSSFQASCTLRTRPDGELTRTCPGFISLGTGIGWILPDAGESWLHCLPPTSAVVAGRPGAALPHAGSTSKTTPILGGWGIAAAPQDKHTVTVKGTG